MGRLLLIATVLLVLLFTNGASKTALASDRHTLTKYFVLPFIEDISGGSASGIPVYDCIGQGHDHDSIIEAAVNALNNTGRMKFEYTPGAETACVLTGEDKGYPTQDDRISIHLDNTVETANFGAKKDIVSFRADDVGTEGDSGMYPFIKGRIVLGPNAHNQWALAHELQHAAGLADLYFPHPTPEGQTCGLDPAHSHAVGDTIMDCDYFHDPGSHDIANLDDLYKNPPTLIDDFEAIGTTYESGGTATVSFEWTDRSYNEKFQFIAMDNDENYIAEDTLVALRDAETLVWSGLTPGTRYCFFIQSLNGYLDPGPASDHSCIDTPPDQSGVYDMLVHWPGLESAAFLHCIVRVNHTVGNALHTDQQCNNDIPDLGRGDGEPPTWEDTCESLATRTPSECTPGALRAAGPDATPGPPGPPPYTLHSADTTATAVFYPEGTTGCGSTPCTILEWCFEEEGSPDGAGVGPNISWRIVLLDPANPESMQLDLDGDTVPDPQIDRVITGSAEVWFNQKRTDCRRGSPEGNPDWPNLTVRWVQAYEEGGFDINLFPVPWRKFLCGDPPDLPCNPNPFGPFLDYDRDGCDDEDELADLPPSDCGDDPYNPTDSFDVNDQDWRDAGGLSGAYDIMMLIARGDCTDAQCTANEPGEYFNCRSNLEHDTGNNNVTMPIYCYHDDAGSDINPEAFPGIRGDGFWGAPPPGPQVAAGPPALYAYGDVDETHTVLTGAFNETSQQIEISGCFEEFASLGDVYMELTLSAHQLPGTVDIWTSQDNATCIAGATFGDYDTVSGEGPPVGPYDDADVFSAIRPGGAGLDADKDGIPDSRELGDEPACGRRDPYNKNDYYDVSIPRDGVIDLANDLLGVIVHFAAGGYPPGDENWDRPPAMIGAGSNWNRGSPDGVIDLANDILGVILQFNPGGCPAQQ